MDTTSVDDEFDRVRTLRLALQKAMQAGGATSLDFPRSETGDEIDQLADDIEALLGQKKPAQDEFASLAKGNIDGEELFHILNSFPVEIVIFNPQFQYIFVNRHAIRNDEVRAWIIGKTDYEYCEYRGVDPVLADQRWELFEEIRKHPRTVSVEQENLTPEGETRYFLRKLSPILNNAGELTYLIGYGFDITDGKKQEKLLQEKNDALEKTNLELDQFVYHSSHDLRAPLLSVMGLIDLLKGESEPALQNRYVDMMQVSVVKLDSFIKEIVKYSKNSRVEFNASRLDLHALATASINSVQFLSPDHEMKFEVEIEGDTPFYSDAFRVETIFNNLVSNAAKYYDPKKANPFLKIVAKIDAEQAELTFQDNGIGIDPEFHDKLFGMFFRASHTAFGSGLGLYIVKRIIEKIEGTIDLTSEVGEGTTFRICLKNYGPEAVAGQKS